MANEVYATYYYTHSYIRYVKQLLLNGELARMVNGCQAFFFFMSLYGFVIWISYCLLMKRPTDSKYSIDLTINQWKKGEKKTAKTKIYVVEKWF